MSDWILVDDLLSGWRITGPQSREYTLQGISGSTVFPRYRGAFEPDEAEPETVRVAGTVRSAGEAAAAGTGSSPATAAAVREVLAGTGSSPATGAAVGTGLPPAEGTAAGISTSPAERADAGAGIFPAAAAATARFRARREFAVSVELDPETWTPAGRSRGWHIFTAGDSAGGCPVLLGLWSSLPASWLAQEPDGTPLPPPWRELWTFGKDHSWCCRLVPAAPDDPGAASAFLESCLASGVTRTKAGKGNKYRSDDLKKELETNR